MAAHFPRFSSPILPPDDTYIDYLEARAKGGVGLIVVAGNSACWPTSRPLQTAFAEDSVITDLKRVADTLHQHGTKVFGQLMHPGTFLSSRIVGGGSTLSASGVPRMAPFLAECQEVPHEMDIDDIKGAEEAFAAAAVRMKKAGYDGVELGAMAGLLHHSFLTRALNHRTDAYGGSLENRMRFMIETLSIIRAAVGEDFVVGIRYGGEDFHKDGNTQEEAIEIARALEAAGKVDYLFPSAGMNEEQYVPSMYFPLSPYTYLSAGVKEHVNLPIITVGRINDPMLAENILANHQADIVAMARALIADPEMPNKAREGKLDDIRKCIGCNEGCVMRPWASLPMTCAMNDQVGNEKERAIIPAQKKKRVMVVGGGAAGMETARVAALRGHKVSIYEKENELAGELILATKAPGRQGWDDARRYLIYQMKVRNVDVHLGVTVTPEMVLDQNVDAVVIATGTQSHIPDIPGVGMPHVVEMKQVLKGESEVGQNVLIVALQNHMHGLQMADFLTEDGRQVEVVTSAIFAGDRLDAHTLADVYRRLLEKNVVFTPLSEVTEIHGNRVTIANVLTEMEKEITGIDSVVFCTPGRPNDALYRALKGKVKELYQVGQCVSPRELLDSIHDGAFVGRQI